MSNSKRTSSNSSNISDIHESNTKRLNVNPISIEPSEIPTDLKGIAELFVKKISDLQQSMNESIEFLGSKLDDVSSQNKTTLQKLNSLEEENQAIKTENKKLLDEIEQLKENQLRLETYQRRNNSLFSGIEETFHESVDECKSKLQKALENIPGNEKFVIGRCHRLGAKTPGKNRDIIAHFPDENNQDQIVQNRKRLPNGVYINEDLPTEIASRKKELLPIFKMAKAKGTYEKVKLKQDKLFIGRIPFTVRPVNNLNTLPADLHPMNSCKKESEHTFVFFGQKHPMSNFARYNIKIDGKLYHSSEQYIQEQKALFFNQNQIASQIMTAVSPGECKYLSKNIPNYNHQSWCQQIPKVLNTALLCKFRQNPECLQTLKNTGRLLIGEATRDTTWGIGLDLKNNDVQKEDKWIGSNLMGLQLMTIREELCE